MLFRRDPAPAPGDDLGPWTGAALSFALARNRHQAPAARAPLAWRLLHEPPQFGLDRSARSADSRRSGTGVVAIDVLPRCMVAVSRVQDEALSAAWSNSPFLHTVLAAVSKDRQGPWHLAYMDAAAGYDGLEQPERAWAMLCSGAFWVNRRGGPWRPFFDAALALAERRGWRDAAIALRDQATLAALDDKRA